MKSEIRILIEFSLGDYSIEVYEDVLYITGKKEPFKSLKCYRCTENGGKKRINKPDVMRCLSGEDAILFQRLREDNEMYLKRYFPAMS